MYNRDRHRRFLTLFLTIATVSLSGCNPQTIEQTFERILERIPSVTRSTPSATPTDPATAAGVQSPRTGEMEAYVYEQINQIRQQRGLEPLGYNAELAQVARDYSKRMATEKFFAHVSPDGGTLVGRVQAADIPYWTVGENLFTCTNAPNPGPLSVTGWMNSPGHRENILRSVFTETGIGVWQSGNSYYFTQLFLRPL